MLRSIIQKSRVIYPVCKALLDALKCLTYLVISKTVKTEDNVILFESFQGRNISCSPKAIYHQALRNEDYKGFKFVWALRDQEKIDNLQNNERTSAVKYGSLSYMKALARAKYWVTNSTMPVYAKPKKEQIFIQNWHGTPLKRLGCDIKTDEAKAQKLSSIHKQYISQGKLSDYFVSPSQFYSEKISTAFAQEQNRDKKFLQLGYPRNDILFKFTKEDASEIKKTLGIPEDKKVILYAPTFRDNSYERGRGFHYDCQIDFDLLYKALSGDYVVLFRAHYFVVDRYNLEKYKGFVYDVSRYEDINDLYVISDMLVTDYSSVFFDYANLNRPIIFYMYDYELYKNKMRDFYLDLSELPGEICYTNEELLSLICKAEKMQCSHSEFNKRFNTYCDANSSQRVLKNCIK